MAPDAPSLQLAVAPFTISHLRSSVRWKASELRIAPAAPALLNSRSGQSPEIVPRRW